MYALASEFFTFSKILEGDYAPLIKVVGILLLVLLFNSVAKSIFQHLQERFGKQQKGWALSFLWALHKPLLFFVWFIALIYIWDILSSKVLSSPLFDTQQTLRIAAVLTFSWFLLRWNRKFIEHLMSNPTTSRASFTPGKLDLIGKLITLFILFLTVFLLMDVTGRNMQTLLAIGGIGGLALAFASQQVISNFFGGLMVYVTQPFTIGEWVSLPEKKIEGHIEEIGWYLTLIRNFEKRPIYVPNSIFTQTIVITPSRMSHERFHQKISLRYEDIKVVEAVIQKIKLLLLHHTSIDPHLKVEVFLTDLNSSSLDIEISAYSLVAPGTQFKALRQELLLKISDIIQKEGAEFSISSDLREILCGSKHNSTS